MPFLEQEGGWPWGLERRLRAAAARHNLTLSVRRGPLLTNFDYVLSAAPLVDDVSSDPWQRDARLVDAGLLLFAPAVLALIAAARQGVLPAAWVPAAAELKRAAALYLALRLVLPFCDVLSLSDLAEALRGAAAGVLATNRTNDRPR